MTYNWPYPIKWDKTSRYSAEVLVIGGGIAGCFAAISAAKKGAKVIMIEKAATISSGAGGSGCDHWESAATNPCSGVSAEELTAAMIKDNNGYNNGISHYIECREGWDRLVDLEQMGAKIRDTNDDFKGADFRDEKSKLLFAYDYINRFTLRVWGSTFKPALYKECKRLGIKIFDRTMATSLLNKNGIRGTKVLGATAINTRTGEYNIFQSGSIILCMSRPSRIWLFSKNMPGISEFRPFQCVGDGHAISWNAGAEFSMMEKSVRAEWSGEGSFPPYSTGNNHNTWYACNMVDAEGREIPWINRDGKILNKISDRYRPADGQRFFIKGGCESDFPIYDFTGPETLATKELIKQGFKLPFYADLTSMPEMERKAIWGLMVGEEGKTKIPVLKNYEDAGFNPETDLLQSYGSGWKSATFNENERQLFGLPGGLMNNWFLKTNIDGLYAAGDQLFASNCFGHAAATGSYAGRFAACFAKNVNIENPDEQQILREKERIYSVVKKTKGLNWQEVNTSICNIMQKYCGAIKSDHLLNFGLDKIKDLKTNMMPHLFARNPHEHLRSLEVLNIITNAEIVLLSCLARKASSKHLHFIKSDYPLIDPKEWHKFITIRKDSDGNIIVGDKDIDYYGSLKENYEENNSDYLNNLTL